MRLLVVLIIFASYYQVIAVSTDIKTKMPTKLNTIQPSQKPELYYQQPNIQQHQPEYVSVQLVQKPYYMAPQPQAVLIIAQPAYVPQNVLYGNSQAHQQQQLLNYFHSNPQAKYQFLYGGLQPHPTAQPFLPQAPTGASTIAAYQVVPGPLFNGYNNLLGGHQIGLHQGPQIQTSQLSSHYVQPMQLNQISHLAQMAAQQYSAPMRSIPPIITGFENFTPEQQAQIKAQLNAHLGTTISTTPTIATSTNQYIPQTTQATHSLNSNEFVQEKSSAAASSNYGPSLMYRAQFTKG